MININIVHATDGFIDSLSVIQAPIKGEQIYINDQLYNVIQVMWDYSRSPLAKVIVEEHNV